MINVLTFLVSETIFKDIIEGFGFFQLCFLPLFRRNSCYFFYSGACQGCVCDLRTPGATL